MKIFAILISFVLITSNGYCLYEAQLRDDGKYQDRKLVSVLDSGYLEIFQDSEDRDVWYLKSNNSEIEFYEPEQLKSLNLDEVDLWLDQTFSGTPYESFGAIVFRATEKDTQEGYDLMVKKAQDSSIPASTITTVVSKLKELGANIE